MLKISNTDYLLEFFILKESPLLNHPKLICEYKMILTGLSWSPDK